MQDLAAAKKVLREKYKNLLEHLSFDDLVRKSFHLRDHFLQQLIEPNADRTRDRYVVSFYPFDTEPQLNIEDESRFEPFQVAYVRITDWKSRHMECRKARRDQPGQWEEIEPVSGVQIFQPSSEQELCSEEEIAIILVPGLAFTRNGDRLGRGAGFYDRFLQAHPQALRVGLAFEDQLADSLPMDAYDQKMDVILTDTGIFSTERFSEWRIQGKVLGKRD